MNDFIDNNTLFLLDSYGLIFREYYAFFSHPLTNSKGQNISALFGFFRNLSILFKNFKPQFFVAAMDSKTPTFRHVQFPDYKANRTETPQDLKDQFPMIEECLEILGVPVIRADGFEADDVIATLAKKCADSGRNCLILSADKDLQQLACDKIHILRPDKVKTWLEYGPAEIETEWGVSPEKILDLLSLTGDSADNVPGVAGIGPKTAVKLISEYGSLEGILENADSIKGAAGQKIKNGKENAILSKKLITLCQNVPLTMNDDFSDFSISKLNFSQFASEMAQRELPAISKAYRELLPSTEKNSQPANLQDIPNSTDDSLIKIKQNCGNYESCTELLKLIEFVDSALEKKFVALDTETDSLNTREANLVGFSLSFSKGSGIYVPLILNEDPLFAPALISKKNAFEQLARLFVPECTIVMHNAKFDLEVLACNGFDALGIGGPPQAFCSEAEEWSDERKAGKSDLPSGRERPLYPEIFDTMVAAWLLEPDRPGKSPFSLETLAEQKLGLKGTEFSQLVGKNQTFADVKLSDAACYGAEDADFTLSLAQLFLPQLNEAGLSGLFKNMEMKVLPVLASMEISGIHIDDSVLKNYALELKTKLLEEERKIYDVVGHEFNIVSPKQLSTVLFEERGLSHGKKTKTGYSTDTDVLESLVNDDPVPGLILDYRAKSKLLSTYVEVLPQMADEWGRVHTNYMQTGTATGRLSSNNPNLQNIPIRSEEGRKIRSAFIAPEGKVLISADYAQIELVVLAHLSGDPNLCQAFNSGHDVHKLTASLIYGVEEELVSPEMRRTAKTLNFGLMYGMGAFRLANELKIQRKQAQEFISSYFNVYSGVESFFDENVKKAEETGFVETIMGRRRFIPGINSSNRVEKEAAIRIAKNTPVQGSAADIVKKAMIDVYGELKKTNSQAKLLLQVHDELILECPDSPNTIEETVNLLTKCMENAVKLRVPLKVSVEYGKSWGEFH